MTYEQITALLDRGFTPDQITLLTTSAAAPTPAADTAPEPEPGNPRPDDTAGANTEPTTETAPAAPDPAPEPAPADNNAAVLDAIKDLKATIQALNILTASVEGMDPDQKLEKAMAEFIRPSFNINKEEGI